MTYLHTILSKSKASKSMKLKVINTVNSFLNFLYGKNKFLTPTLVRLLCVIHSYNTLQLTHTIHPNLITHGHAVFKYDNKNWRIGYKLQIENVSGFLWNYTREHFNKSNWLSIEHSVLIQQISNINLANMNEVFEPANQLNITMQKS